MKFQYKVLSSTDARKLEKLIEEASKEGLYPQGGLVVHQIPGRVPLTYYQAIATEMSPIITLDTPTKIKNL